MIVLLLVAGAFAAPAVKAEPSARTATYSLDIPAQNLNDALQALALVSRHKLLYSTPIVAGKTSTALKGQYTAEEAVKRMLSGTDLTYELTADGLVLIRSGGAGKSSGLTGTAEGLLLAVADEEAREEKAAGEETEDARQVTVRDRKVKPDFTANADIPRTINDAQPYYVFDAKTINRSGAANLEDFLKQRLTMNAAGLTGAQNSYGASPGPATGNVSSIDLRGLGADKTLVLVNGRRMASALASLSQLQSDINGIPLSAVERVEVLPTSASGIYGSSAIGGVVNIILKRDFSGGDVRANYENVFGTDASTRTLSAAFGAALGHRTQLTMSAQRSEASSMLIRDRLDVLERNIARIRENNPAFLYSATNPALGLVPNIAAVSGNLTLKASGSLPAVPLGVNITHIPAGTAPDTSLAELRTGLLANAGQYNIDFPSTTQYPFGLDRALGSTPETTSLRASLRQQVLPWLEAFLDVNYADNDSRGVYNPAGTFVVSAAALTNPFTGNVRVRVPYSIEASSVTSLSRTRSATLGFNARLPHEWMAEIDYSWSRADTSYFYSTYNSSALSAALNCANTNCVSVNPFVDTLRFGFDLDRFILPVNSIGRQDLKDVALRGAGPLPSLPWGAPQLAAGLEWREAASPEATAETEFQLLHFYPRQQVTKSAYGELTVPLVRAGRFPLLHLLEAQAAGRGEEFTVDTGTVSYYYLRTNPTQIVYGSPNINGQPFFDRATYRSNNYTLGLRYQPIAGLTLRASRASAFIPPTPTELAENPLVREFGATITRDPRDPSVTGSKPIPNVFGGNPDLKPQSSESTNAGLIWEPRWAPPGNLRLNLEYYRVVQNDAITALTAQAIVDNEDLFPGRVTRDEDGHITFLNIRNVNLFGRETEGVDFSLDYRLETGSAGTWTLRGQHSTILKLKTQYSQTSPAYDGAGFPNDSDGALKHKSNLTLGWERGNSAVAWTARYFGSYNQVGSPGGPSSMRNANGGVWVNGALTAQGSFTIPSQIYHDLMFEYDFGQAGAGRPLNVLLSNLSVQVGIKNLFDKLPPFDAQQLGYYYYSPFGDLRLRSYWVSVRRGFN